MKEESDQRNRSRFEMETKKNHHSNKFVQIYKQWWLPSSQGSNLSVGITGSVFSEMRGKSKWDITTRLSRMERKKGKFSWLNVTLVVLLIRRQRQPQWLWCQSWKLAWLLNNLPKETHSPPGTHADFTPLLLGQLGWAVIAATLQVASMSISTRLKFHHSPKTLGWSFDCLQGAFLPSARNSVGGRTWITFSIPTAHGRVQLFWLGLIS